MYTFLRSVKLNQNDRKNSKPVSAYTGATHKYNFTAIKLTLNSLSSFRQFHLILMKNSAYCTPSVLCNSLPPATLFYSARQFTASSHTVLLQCEAVSYLPTYFYSAQRMMRSKVQYPHDRVPDILHSFFTVRDSCQPSAYFLQCAENDAVQGTISAHRTSSILFTMRNSCLSPAYFLQCETVSC